MAGIKDGKEKKGRDDGNVAAQIKRLASELAALRADVESIRARDNAASPLSSDNGDGSGSTSANGRRSKAKSADANSGTPDGAPIESSLVGDNDATVSIGHAYRILNSETGEVTTSSGTNILGGLNRILESSDAQVARFGLAFSSAPKIALIRTLLREGSRSATDLGEQAGLTTGSLYHHLRELTHSGVIESIGRGRFGLTGIGRETALVLFAQAGRREEAADN